MLRADQMYSSGAYAKYMTELKNYSDFVAIAKDKKSFEISYAASNTRCKYNFAKYVSKDCGFLNALKPHLIALFEYDFVFLLRHY